MNKLRNYTVSLGLLLMSTLALGYSFDFTNKTEGPVRVRVKLSGINEPWYYATLNGKIGVDNKPSTKGRSYDFSFNVGSELTLEDGKKEFTGRKLGFCLSQIQLAPYEKDKDGKFQETDEWEDMSPYFIETNYFDKMIQAAAKLGEGSTKAAGDIIKTAGDAAGKKKVKKAGANVQEAATSVKGIVESIGETISTTLCKDRSFTILPNIKIEAGASETATVPNLRDSLLITNQR